MKKGYVFIFALLFLGHLVYCQLNGQSDFEAGSEHFSFHINKWINLHHFFYERASKRQAIHLEENKLKFLDYGEAGIINGLNEEEKAILEQVQNFYSSHIIDRPLLLSGKSLKWLQKQASNKVISDTSFSAEFTAILNRSMPLYEKHFWPLHYKLSQKLLAQYIDTIRATEAFVISKMESFSGVNWNDKVRVDLTAYGNWASAYSPDFDNIVISSIDPEMHSSLFVEFVFHEGSHLLFTRRSAFRKTLFEKSKKLEISYPKNLWHAAMFYLSGLASQEALLTIGVRHRLIMDRKNVFANYYNDENFRSILSKYYHGKINLNEMALHILKPE